ncbi:MAG: EAL domain-containing protein [Angelakisella sp.]
MLYYFTTLWGGTIQQMNNNAYEIFNQKVKNRKSYLENDMIHRWSNIEEAVATINESWDVAQHNGYSSSADLLADPEAVNLFLEEVSEDIIYVLRKNTVTGAFIILDQPLVEKDNIVSRPGLYVRDSDPASSAKDNSDLAIKHGAASLYRTLGITTDILWTPRFSFNSELPEECNYFTKPMEAAKEYPTLSAFDLGYWSPPIPTSNNSHTALTYTLPLIDRTGTVYGVMGVDISADYIKKMLPSNELNDDKRAAYCLAQTNPYNDKFYIAFSSGSLVNHHITPGSTLTLQNSPYRENSYLVADTENDETHADVQYLQLYNKGTPFADEQWALLGIVNRRSLLSFSDTVSRISVVSALATILVGILFVCIAITLLINPIKKLIAMLRSSDPNKPVTLTRVHVTEIDELSTAIEDLSLRVSESSSTLSRIIEMSGINIAAFEVDKQGERVVYTGQFFSLLCIGTNSTEKETTTIHAFRKKMEDANFILEETLENGWIIRTYTEKKVPRWIKITRRDEPNRILGVIVDITEETLSKRHIEYERDYDLLTSLLNRRAFMVAIQKLFENPQGLKTAALLMLDLDNLKFINDNYGHDCGDGYLRAVASAMKKLPLQNVLLARMSGDEFFLFLYGYDTKEQVQHYINELKDIIGESYYILPGGDTTRIRCSAGVTWYPEDTTLLDDLIRYSDFAMYSAKNSKKGDFVDFCMADYNKNSYLLHSREELNKLIDLRLVDYHFQPIVDTQTGCVFAYEALMRSQLDTLKSPLEILALARSQSKLYDIEKLTWFSAMELAVNDPVFREGDCHIFINSVSNNILSDDDIKSLGETFQEYLHRIVLEVTEEEKFNEGITRQKQQLLYQWGGAVALDDFGTGYNGEMVLLQLVPDYVKIDMSIVRNIDSDPSRKELFGYLVSYSHERGIKVIAEGVETASEMDTLIRLGADYLQGYYLGKPEPIMKPIPIKIQNEICRIAGNMVTT